MISCSNSTINAISNHSLQIFCNLKEIHIFKYTDYSIKKNRIHSEFFYTKKERMSIEEENLGFLPQRKTPGLGLEPRLTTSEAAVLPLDDPGTKLQPNIYPKKNN